MFVLRITYFDWCQNMIFKLITGVIFILVIEKALMVITDEIISNEIDTEEDPEKSKSNIDAKMIDLEESNNTLALLEDVSQNTTSQDRVSYHTKRRAPKYSRYTLHSIHRPSKSYLYRGRSPYSKSRRKHKRSRRKPYLPSFSSPAIISDGPPIISSGPSIVSSGSPSAPSFISGAPPFLQKLKNPFKFKPLLLSEFLRSSQPSFLKPKPNTLAPRPVHEFVNEGEVPGGSPSFTSVASAPPSLSQFGRPPPSIEVSDLSDSVPPVNAIEEEVIYPGTAPGSSFKRPVSNDDIFLDEGTADTTRNVRLATQAPNTYADREILNLLQKMKENGLTLESRPETTTSRNKVKETTAAITKLLTPFLSENSIKKIRSYLNLGLSGTQKKESETEKNVNNIVIVENPKSDEKSISVKEPTKDDESNAQYFIMLKQKNNKTASTTVGVQTLKNKAKEASTSAPETKTPMSLQSLELQHYIMSLAGVGEPKIKDPKSTGDDFLPQFSAFQDKQPRSL